MKIYIKELLLKIEDRFSEDSINMPMSEWIEKNTTLKGKEFSFKGYEFQRQIMDDMHPNMVCIKPSQVGLTEGQIRKALGFLCRNKGSNLIFSLPTEDMHKRISKGRVKPIVDKDKVFNTAYDKQHKSVRSADMMQFGQSFLYLVPAIESAATSIAADVVMNDEVDLSDQKMISLFNSRLQGSDIAISQRFSTPTFPSYGVDLDYRSSDQHEYVCDCSSCGHVNSPEFNRKFIHIEGLPDEIKELHKITIDMQDLINLDHSYVKCEKCHAPLDLDDVSKRRWVAKYPNRSMRGYRVTPFVTGRLSVKYIVEALWRYQKNDYIRGFFNTVLGHAYSDGSIQIPKDLIEACMDDLAADYEPRSKDKVWVGIDMGQTCHIVLGVTRGIEKLRIFKIMSVHVDDLIDTVTDICNKYPVVAGCVDRHPYEPKSRDVYSASGGRILPIEYRGTKELNLVYNEYKEVTHGQVDRTTFLDHFATLIRKGKLNITGYGMSKMTYVEHIRDMVRDETPDKPAVWKKLTGNDHYFHASAFMAYAPKVEEYLNLNSDEDERTMVSTQIVATQSSGGLIGSTSNRKNSIANITNLR